MTSAGQSTNRPDLGRLVAGGVAQARAEQVAGGGAMSVLGAPEASALSRLQRQPSLTERVFRQLRDAIVNNELAPNALVSIEHLAGMLGVSRTPIREGLPALQQMGLIVQSENGNFRVAPLDKGYAWEVYAVRSAIESLAAEVVAPRLTDDD